MSDNIPNIHAPSHKTFRLSLNSDTILYLLAVSKSDYANSILANDHNRTSRALAAIAKLSVYQAKIDNAGLATAYTSTGAPTKAQRDAGVLASVGGVVAATTPPNFPPTFPKERFWEQCYIQEIEHGIEALSITEIEASREHKYLHDLMSPAEIAHFEGRDLTPAEQDNLPDSYDSPEPPTATPTVKIKSLAYYYKNPTTEKE